MKTQIPTLTLLASALTLSLGTAASAQTVITLVGDDANSTPQRAGTVADTLNDPFAYNITDPTATAPELVYGEDTGANTANGFHGNNTANPVVIAYTLALDYTVGLDEAIVLDTWGRNRSRNFGRDDDYTVTLLNDGAVVATLAGEGILDNDTLTNRSTFDTLAAGTVIDAVQLSSTADGQFTIQEVRFGAVAVPEPASLALIGLGSLAMIGRRKKV